jgi:hypothetical protein
MRLGMHRCGPSRQEDWLAEGRSQVPSKADLSGHDPSKLDWLAEVHLCPEGGKTP